MNEIVQNFKKSLPPSAGRADTAKTFNFGRIPYSVYRGVMAAEKSKVRKLRRSRTMLLSKKQLISKYMVEVHKKYSIPVACLVFVLIGAPLGIMARSSGIGVGVAYSLAFFIVYWIFLIGGESLADRLMIPAWLAMWSPNIIIGAIGIWLTTRMVRETTFFSYDWLKRLGAKLKRRKTGHAH